MKRFYYLLLVMLLLPFVGAKADGSDSWNATTQTVTYGNNTAGSFSWYASTAYNADDETDKWGGQTFCQQAVNLVLSGTLNNADIIAVRDMINNHNLRTLDLSDAIFINDNAGTCTGTYNGETKTYSGFYGYYDEFGTEHFNNGCVAGQIGKALFADCVNLTSVVLPTNITIVGEGAFRGCTNLTSVKVPSTVTEFDWQCFDGDSKLTDLPINGDNLNSLVTINSQAFRDCSLLADSYFNNFTNVTTVGYKAFQNTLISALNVNRLLATFVHGNTNSTDAAYNKLPWAVFADCKNIKDAVDLTANGTRDVIAGIDGSAFLNCTGLTGVNINKNVSEIGENAFAGCTSLASVTVHRSVAPTCPVNAFTGVTPNSCEVIFLDDAYKGPFVLDNYNTTENINYLTDDYYNGNMGYRSYYDGKGFEYLLTKTMNEDNTTYDVVNQYHAKVKLIRTFKVGWNTLCLPFGSSSWDVGQSVTGDCADLYKNAMAATTNSNFMIAAYRGLKSGKVFTFIHYANMDTDPLDEFEPIMVKMSQSDIDAHTSAGVQTYTFTDVNVDIDKNTGTKYGTSVEPLTTINGAYNVYTTDPGAVFTQGNTYDKYLFMGTFKKVFNLLGSNDYYIYTTGGTSYFMGVESGKSYASRGFRGYFHDKTLSANAQPSSLSVQVFNEDGSDVTGIMNMTMNGEQISNSNLNIYNMNGQLVRANSMSTDGLSKGIYIVNGKKVIIK